MSYFSIIYEIIVFKSKTYITLHSLICKNIYFPSL